MRLFDIHPAPDNSCEYSNAHGKALLISKGLQKVFCCFSRVLQRYRFLVKARQGESIITDMRKLQKGGETNCSLLWHQAALCATNVTQQLAYYKNSISSLTVLHSVLSLLWCFYWHVFNPLIQCILSPRLSWVSLCLPYTANYFKSLCHHHVEVTCHYNNAHKFSLTDSEHSNSK